MGDLRAAPVVGPGGRGGAPPSRPNDLNSTTKITHSIFFYPSVSTFTSAARAWLIGTNYDKIGTGIDISGTIYLEYRTLIVSLHKN